MTRRCPLSRRPLLLLTLAALLPTALTSAAARAQLHPGKPNVVIVTVDALRADHLSSYGYARPTSPAIDALLARGVRFTDARTPEPLTAPAMTSMLTALEPDVHGASRNAVPVRRGLDSLATILSRHGYRSAAFVSNWTLRARLSGLDEYFDEYVEVLTHKRWYGLVGEEASAEEVNGAVELWTTRRGTRRLAGTPWFLWIHYVDPHAPYKLHRDLAPRLGIRASGATKLDRYDSEIANADRAIERLLARLLAPDALGPDTLVVFAADHGESLGEHDYWGHGRNLYEPTVRVPLGFVWPGHLEPATVDAPASLLDVAPTVLGLLGIVPEPRPQKMAGLDWTPLFAGAPPPLHRRLLLQAHKGAVQTRGGMPEKREAGLLQVGVVQDGVKRVWRVKERKLQTFDLAADAGELHDLTPASGREPPLLVAYVTAISERLGALGTPEQTLDAESVARLRALGYLP